ncbi:hypothetical protein LRP49_03770 [Enterovibrio sp. ZSDZ35]|uniref:Transposase n=1 Tax=Enterovibrio qingdaonensis TaxID=2899818 RepID=A0ABT5QH52_9GAMM|nr:hypothetical protein [Enterovibrio sp. ZSDZ35]MDD1780312.1 hypothetical protein [Enterovibrio sp. ZSDZ35]
MFRSVVELIENNRESWLSELTKFYGKEYGHGWKSCGFQSESALASALQQLEKQESDSQIQRIRFSES